MLGEGVVPLVEVEFEVTALVGGVASSNRSSCSSCSDKNTAAREWRGRSPPSESVSMRHVRCGCCDMMQAEMSVMSTY